MATSKPPASMTRVTMAVLWPAFMVAIMAEGIFFSVYDPHDFTLAGTSLSANAVYTAGFFFFWLLCAIASMLSCILIGTQRGAPPGE